MPIGTWKNPFPLRLGGRGHKEIEDIYESAKAMRPTILQGAGGEVESENMTYARMIATARRATTRRIVQVDPSRLSSAQRDYVDAETGETLTKSPLERMEKILQIYPAPNTSLKERREAVAGKVRSFASNAADQVVAIAQSVLGDWYYSVETNTLADVAAGNVSHYWPDGSGTTNQPGAADPDYPWWSALCHVLVVYDKPASATLEEETAKQTKLWQILDDVLPAWCTYDVGRLDAGGALGFYVDSSELDYTAI